MEQSGNTFAFQFAGKSIAEIYGSLDDLPGELADTIANQYVKTAILLRDMQENRVPPDVPLEACLEKLAELQATLEHLPAMIETLREMKRDGNEVAFLYSVTFLLDDLKYGIENAREKSQEVRELERDPGKIVEIQNLYQILKSNRFLR